MSKRNDRTNENTNHSRYFLEAFPGVLGKRGTRVFLGEQGNESLKTRGTRAHRQFWGTGNISCFGGTKGQGHFFGSLYSLNLLFCSVLVAAIFSRESLRCSHRQAYAGTDKPTKALSSVNLVLNISLSTNLPNEPAHEIMALFVLRKLILQTRMCRHPVGLDV